MARTTGAKHLERRDDGAERKSLPSWTAKLKEALAQQPVANAPATPASNPDGSDDPRSRPFPGAA